MFPQLRILSGIEAGEPHYFPASVASVLGAGHFERVLGSLHSIPLQGKLEWVDADLFSRLDPHDLMDRYFTDMAALVASCDVFSVLAHCDYPRRYWPQDRAGAYREAAYEEHYRTVFRTLAASERALEINTRSPLASVELIRWWWEEGGDVVSYGSDAHHPERIGDQFELAVDIVETAGFRPGRDRYDFWRR
jgi:histidinol-phosphatase (PHP family)